MKQQMSNEPSPSQGMTLIEVMIALVLVALTALAVAPMFAFASHNNAVGRDQGIVGALAIEKMEDLFEDDYADLTVGGGLASNVAGYFEIESDEFVTRWEIVDNNSPANTKVVTVRVIAPQMDFGARREVTLTMLRAR